MAEQADIHELYEESVQNVENEIEFLQTTFRELRGRTGYLFRETYQFVDDLADKLDLNLKVYRSNTSPASEVGRLARFCA